MCLVRVAVPLDNAPGESGERVVAAARQDGTPLCVVAAVRIVSSIRLDVLIDVDPAFMQTTSPAFEPKTNLAASRAFPSKNG